MKYVCVQIVYEESYGFKKILQVYLFFLLWRLDCLNFLKTPELNLLQIAKRSFFAVCRVCLCLLQRTWYYLDVSLKTMV